MISPEPGQDQNLYGHLLALGSSGHWSASSRNIDVFNVATRERNGKTICFEAFQMKLDGFPNRDAVSPR